jgi:hypothetical protein
MKILPERISVRKMIVFLSESKSDPNTTTPCMRQSHLIKGYLENLSEFLEIVDQFSEKKKEFDFFVGGI